MKKFLYPLPLAALLCVFFFNCSNEGFEKPKDSEIAKLAGLPDSLLNIKDTIVKCFVEESCYEINKIACKAIGGEEKPDKECISFTCEWKSNSVEYGQKSTLSFKWGNAAQEGCSYAISYNKNTLDTIEYTISRATFSDLLIFKDTSIVATATVTCGTEAPKVQNCKPLKVKAVPINFSCGWDSVQVKYGEKSTFSFAFDDQASANLAQKEGCTLRMSPLDTGVARLVSASTIAGLSYSKDTTIVATAAVTCGTEAPKVQNCNPLRVIHVPGPEKTGTLSFKKFDYENYFFIGTKIDSTYINNEIKITNKEEAGCGDIKIKIEGSPAQLGSQVRATAVVTCEHIGEFELAGISAEVLPDPALGDCKLIGNWDAMMFKKDTLFMNVPIENNYGRCKVQNDTLPLKNYSGKVNDITAKVVCGTTTTNKKCSEEVFVADKFAEIKECHNPRVQIGPGITVVEITCKDGDTPAKTFGCDCSGGDWSATNIFTINGVKAQGGGCWATASIPADIANKESKRVLIEYNKEIGCVAY